MQKQNNYHSWPEIMSTTQRHATRTEPIRFDRGERLKAICLWFTEGTQPLHF